MPDKIDEAAELRKRLKKRLEAKRIAKKVMPVKKPGILKGLKNFFGLEDLLERAAEDKKKK